MSECDGFAIVGLIATISAGVLLVSSAIWWIVSVGATLSSLKYQVKNLRDYEEKHDTRYWELKRAIEAFAKAAKQEE